MKERPKADLQIGFIGYGSMAEGMIGRIIRKRITRRENIGATGPHEKRAEELGRTYGIWAGTDNVSLAESAPVIVLSVKPKDAPSVFTQLRGRIPQSTLVISIMAGISLGELMEGLGTRNVIRTMPNTPGKIGAGFTGWTASPEIGDDKMAIVRKILSSLGKEQYFKNEYLLHAVTAAASSAVAFVCEFTQALISAAAYLGLSWGDAREIVIEVMKGTIALIEKPRAHPAVLRDEVSSPGGTTVEGLRILEEGRFRFTVLEAVRAAFKKSIELGEKRKA